VSECDTLEGSVLIGTDLPLVTLAKMKSPRFQESGKGIKRGIEWLVISTGYLWHTSEQHYEFL
jgi:hypothetical protein